MTDAPRTLRYVPLDEVNQALRNPRTHTSLEQVKANIRRIGFVEVGIHDGRTDRIIAGHGRLQALTEMSAAGEDPPEGIVVADGRWRMPITYGWSSTSDAEAETALVNLNRLVETGGWDDTELARILARLREDDDSDLIGLTGFSESEVDDLLKNLLDDDAELPDDRDEVPPLTATPRSKVGDVWVLGNHRLAVGDATERAVIEAAMGGAEADMVWTDPPYGVGYDAAVKRKVNHRKDDKIVANDTLEGLDMAAFLGAAFENADAVCKPGGAWYVAVPAGPAIIPFVVALNDLGIVRHSIVWVKHRFVFGATDYHYRHEEILYGWKPGAPRHAVPTRDQDSVWEYDMPHRSEDHPTMKPVELVTRALRNSSDQGAVVLDPFAGSGTTLVAAEITKRQARCVEIDERYADVILDRWVVLTGGDPERESDGALWSTLRASISPS